MNRKTERPNVIVFFTDQQRHDTAGIHGCPLGLTPNFDRFARRGTHIANSFTCQPVCGPARACFQTGVYATQNGVWRNGFSPRRGLPTLARCFNEAGYATGYIGKWHLMPHDTPGAVPPEGRCGYQHWLAANLLEFVSDPYDTHLWDGEGREHRLPGYRTDALVDAAIRHIDSRAREAQPFFLFLSLLEPHHQNHTDNYPAPHAHEECHGRGWIPPDLQALGGTSAQHWPGYCGLVKRCDEAFGRMLDALESLRLRDRTVVLYSSDHGCHFKTRNAEYKRSCHEASIHVPTAIAGPGFDSGRDVTQLCSLIDLPPTLLDAAGIAPPGSMMGRPIGPLARGDAVDWPDDVFVQISESQTGRCVRTRRWKYSVRCPENAPDGRPVARESADSYADDFLYDLEADPWELTNLAGIRSYAAIVADMRARLVRRMTACGEKEPRFIDAPPRDVDQRSPENRYR